MVLSRDLCTNFVDFAPIYIILFQMRGMHLNLLFCYTFCALLHTTLWPWNYQTRFLLDDMLLLVMGTQSSGPR